LITEAAIPTRERILDAALELFGRQGYAATSVGEIEAAAGLSPRSGALYKHFPSKRALLLETVRRRGRTVDEITHVVDQEMVGDVRAELHLLGRMAMHEIRNDQPALRIVMREGDNFPELREEFYARIVSNGHGQAVEWLRLVARRTGVPEAELDLEALAAILLASIIGNRICEAIFGRPPLDVEAERFLAVWQRSAEALLAAHGLVPDQETQT
jgi:AcrR family transcriptional regulator